MQPAAPTKLGAQTPERMAAGDLVASVGAEEEERLRLERTREHGQELERGVVRPVQVVEKDRSRAAAGDRREGTPNRLEECWAIAPFRGRAELGQEKSQVRRERAAVIHPASPAGRRAERRQSERTAALPRGSQPH